MINPAFFKLEPKAPRPLFSDLTMSGGNGYIFLEAVQYSDKEVLYGYPR